MLTPGDLLRSVWQKSASVIFIALLVAVAVVGIAMALPNRFASDGMMYVRLGRAALSADPTALQSASGGVSIQENRSAEVISVAEMLASHEIASRAVDRVGIDRINAPRTWIDRVMGQLEELRSSGPSSAPEGLSLAEFELQLEREAAIKKIHQWLSIETPKNGYTVSVTAQGPDPMLMRAITQTVMDQYTSYHVEAHQTDGSVEFFEQQVAKSRSLAVAAREALQSARSEFGWMSLESAESALRDRIIQLEVALDQAEGDLAQTKTRSEALASQLAETDQWIPMEIMKGIANAAGDSMRSTLFGEQVQESEQLATIKPDHPRYRLLQEKMIRSAEIVTDEEGERQLTREAINPIWQRLEGEFSLASAESSGLRSKCESLRTSRDEAETTLLKLNRDAVELSRLKWQADIAEETLLGHAKSLQDALVRSELDRRKISDVSVIQDASLNLKKVGPPRTLIAVVGAFLGLGIGVLQAIVRSPMFVPPQPSSIVSENLSTEVTRIDTPAAAQLGNSVSVSSGVGEQVPTERGLKEELGPINQPSLPR